MSTSIVLVCAVLASLAAGVLVAYVLCQAMFAVFHIRARRIAKSEPPLVVVSSQVAEG